MGSISAMFDLYIAAQRLLIVLALMGIPCAICQTTDLIKGELEVLVTDSQPPVFIVRDGLTVNPVIVPEDAVDELIPYAGYTVQLRPAAPPTGSVSPPRAPRNRPNYVSRAMLGSDSTVNSIEVFERADKSNEKEATGGRNLSSVVYLVSFCGWKTSISAAAFGALWLNTPKTPPGTYNVQNFWANCTQRLANMVADDQIIVDVPLPCSGTIDDKPYDFQTTCTTNEQYAWVTLAEQYAANMLDVDPSIKQRIVVLPKETPCKWAAAANLGCRGTRCAVWIHGNEATNPMMYMRAMGSNLGLVASMSSLESSGDSTCAMGSGKTCFNMANLWRLGWAKAIPDGELDSSNFPVGTWKTLQLPYATQELENHIRIVLDWAPASDSSSTGPAKARFPGYYVSLRKNEQFDAVSPSLVPSPGRVLIHSSYATQAENSFQASNLESVLSVGATYRAKLPFGIVVTVKDISLNTGATVQVCRADSTNEGDGPGQCNDGLDNDCDGLIDGDDLGCASARMNAPPPPLGTRKPK